MGALSLPLNRCLGQLSAQNSHLLQMYGEKAEEAQELQLDLQDVKSLYQGQIQQLLMQLDQVATL
jgi:hypothetical protein